MHSPADQARSGPAPPGGRPAAANAARRARVEQVGELFLQTLEARSLMQPSPVLQLDLTMPQLKALVAIGLRGPMRLNHLAEAIGATPTGVTGIVDRLAERGYLERSSDPSDRRATVVALRAPGEAVLTEMYAAGREDIQRVLAGMADDDLDDVERGMRALLRAIRASLAADGVSAAPLDAAPRG